MLTGVGGVTDSFFFCHSARVCVCVFLIYLTQLVRAFDTFDTAQSVYSIDRIFRNSNLC